MDINLQDLQALLASGVASVKLQGATCIHCATVLPTIEAAAAHDAECPKHPAVIERDRLRDELAGANAANKDEFMRGWRTALAEVAVSMDCDIRSIYKGQPWADKIIAIQDRLAAATKRAEEAERYSRVLIRENTNLAQQLNESGRQWNAERGRAVTAEADLAAAKERSAKWIAEADQLRAHVDRLREALGNARNIRQYTAVIARSARLCLPIESTGTAENIDAIIDHCEVALAATPAQSLAAIKAAALREAAKMCRETEYNCNRQTGSMLRDEIAEKIEAEADRLESGDADGSN
jgi:hypothetical protein